MTCDDCFFRRAQLCAIPGNTPCPTFRPVERLGEPLRATAAAPAAKRAVASV